MNKLLTVIAIALGVSACTNIQPFVLDPPPDQVSPSGQQVAAILGNFKCELLSAVLNREELDYFNDDPSLQTQNSIHNESPHKESRVFSLANIFDEIDFVAEAQLTLDVTGSSGLNPSLAFIHPYTAMTNRTISAGGQLNETSHRNMVFYSSVDFDRLTAYNKYKKEYPLQASCVGLHNRYSDLELGGQLGIKEYLANGLQVAAQNDVGLWPTVTEGEPTKTIGYKLPTADISQYLFGEITAQIDFTTTEAINAGPTWNLSHFKGPSGGGSGGGGSGATGGGGASGGSSAGGGGSQGLVNLSRIIKNQLSLIFVPACVKEKYHLCIPRKEGSPCGDRDQIRTAEVTATLRAPFHYYPEMVVGTPGWANYLPQCKMNDATAQYNALAAAKEEFILRGFQSGATP